MQATVVVSCYKQEDYIAECLNSILNQEVSFDFDILIADDCSPDTTPEILKRFAEQYPSRIKLILRSKNVGAAENYIDVHNQAKGEIVFHFDGDDVMLPGKLQKQFDVFRENPEVNLVFHRARYFSDDGSYEVDTGKPCFLKGNLMYFNMSDLALWGTIAVHSAYAYRRSSRVTKNLNREFMEWFFAMDSLSLSNRGVYLDDVLVKYRCNPSGGAYLSTRNGRIKAYKIYLRDVLHYSVSEPGIRKELYANCLFTSLAMCRAGCGISLEALDFIVRNFYLIRPALFINVLRMRRSVAPALRIR